MINLFGPINDLGYGVHFYNTATWLARKTDCTISPIGKITKSGPVDPFIQTAVSRAASINLKDPSICIFHEFALQYFTGSPMIGFSVFETDKIIPAGVNLLNQMEEAWVTSEWGKKVLEDNGITRPIIVMHEGVDPKIFNPGVLPSRAHEDTSRFTIVNVGKYEMRKGHPDLLAVLEDKFPTEEIRLLAMWNNPFIPEFGKWLDQVLRQRGWERLSNISNRLIYKYNNLRLEVVPQQPSAAAVASVMKCADLAVYPHRGEGWGLPIIESMACGVPTIATDYSGPSEYLTDENSLPLTFFTKEIANDGTWFRGDKGNWVVPDKEELEHAIRKGMNNEVPVAPEGFGMDWSWDSAAERILGHLQRSGIAIPPQVN